MEKNIDKRIERLVKAEPGKDIFDKNSFYFWLVNELINGVLNHKVKIGLMNNQGWYYNFSVELFPSVIPSLINKTFGFRQNQITTEIAISSVNPKTVKVSFPKGDEKKISEQIFIEYGSLFCLFLPVGTSLRGIKINPSPVPCFYFQPLSAYVFINLTKYKAFSIQGYLHDAKIGTSVIQEINTRDWNKILTNYLDTVASEHWATRVNKAINISDEDFLLKKILGIDLINYYQELGKDTFFLTSFNFHKSFDGELDRFFQCKTVVNKDFCKCVVQQFDKIGELTNEKLPDDFDHESLLVSLESRVGVFDDALVSLLGQTKKPYIPADKKKSAILDKVSDSKPIVPPIFDIKELSFYPKSNKVDFITQDNGTIGIQYTAPKFWMFWFLAKEYQSKNGEKSWLQFPEKHLDVIDEIWLKWHGVKFIDHLAGIISDYFDSANLPMVKSKEDLKTLIRKWDNKFFEYFDQLPGNKHKSWVLDIKGNNRRNIKTELIKPLKEHFSYCEKLFETVRSNIRNRKSPFKINTSLKVKIALIK